MNLVQKRTGGTRCAVANCSGFIRFCFFCVYLSLSLWLELNLKNNPNSFELFYVFSFSNNIDIPTGGNKAKDVVQNVFGQKVFNQEEFLNNEGPLGSHSI
jgi:hypothetical protein